jgi:translation elongation factor P/translation initiation factor 5A
MRPGASRIGKIKAFSTKTKTKEIFKGGSKIITIILQQQKLFNYYTRKAQ